MKHLCRMLGVSRSGFYRGGRGSRGRNGMGQRQQRAGTLLEQIRTAHQLSRGTYGSPRIAAELKARGVQVCENTVAKYMRQMGLRSLIKRRFVPRTTDSKHRLPVAQNLLNRDFAATKANTRWTCDITYIPSDQGWLYLAVVMDLFSRRIVGWSMMPHLRSELVSEALLMALKRRRPCKGRLLHHSDRGVQYACGDYQKLLARHGITCSMSRTGNCYDNAVMESFFGTLKSEHVDRHRYPTREQARSSVFEWIEVFYNRQRRHSSLKYLSPETFEAQQP